MTTTQFDAWSDSPSADEYADFMDEAADHEQAEVEAFLNDPAYQEWCEHQNRIIAEHNFLEIMRPF